jgi:ATP-binding cassette subfamily B protein
MTRLRERMHALLVPAGEGALVDAAPPVQVREILRRFWPDARAYRRWIPLGLVLIAIGAVIETAEIWMFKLVVDEVLVPGELEPLVWIVALYVGLTLVNGLVSFGDDYLATWLAERFLQRMRRRVFSHVQALSVDVLDRRRLGDLIARLTSDVQAIERCSTCSGSWRSWRWSSHPCSSSWRSASRDSSSTRRARSAAAPGP